MENYEFLIYGLSGWMMITTIFSCYNDKIKNQVIVRYVSTFIVNIAICFIIIKFFPELFK